MEIPDFYRTETWHPVSVHWPIVLLTIGTFFYIAGVWKKSFLYPSARILLGLGVAGAWLAIYTGNLSDGVVSRKLCDPTVLKTHENYAYTLSYIFTAAFAADLVKTWLSKKIHKFLSVLVILLLLSGTGFLLYTGHLGGQLVYQQAAGVYQPSEDCAEFE
ncbi:MAG: DUF2231 domain-containing protein [Candidatus Cyclobacteriaceae bacterium M3_2C_046]